GPNDLQTNSASCNPQPTGGAQGSTNEFLPSPTPTPTPSPSPTPTPTPTPTLTPTPTPTPPPGVEGCTPGSWKANCDKKGANAWPNHTCSTPLLTQVFTLPGCLATCSQTFTTLP